jgi:CheY-like chemotaxis protein
LADHRVDSARTYDEALTLINGTASYDLALIDLNLTGEDDRTGGEILDLLRMEFPATRRVIVTGSPPAGGLRSDVFERYGVEDVIIKGKMTLPGLRIVVTRALRGEADETPQEVKSHESELMERYRDWRDRTEEKIRSGVRNAQNNARDAGIVRGQSQRSAEIALNSWLALQMRFGEVCKNLEDVVSSGRAIGDVSSGMAQLDQAMNEFEIAMVDPAEPALPRKSAVDVAIITILPEELRATLRAFNVAERPQMSQPFYETQVPCQSRPERALEVVITSAAKPLNVHVGAPIFSLRDKYSPNAVFLVGIAGGRQGKVRQGEVVIGKSVFYYESTRLPAEVRTHDRNGQSRRMNMATDFTPTIHGKRRSGRGFNSLSAACRNIIDPPHYPLIICRMFTERAQ